MKDENIHIGKLFGEIIKYWKVYIPVGIICLIVAIVFILVTPKEWGITARMQLRSETEGMMSELKMLKGSGLASMLGGGGGGGVTTEDEIGIMLARRNLSQVIAETDMQLQTKRRVGWKKQSLYKKEVPVDYIFPTSFLDTLVYPINIKLSVDANKKATATLKSKYFKTIKIKNQPLPVVLNTSVGTITIQEKEGVSGAYKLQTKLVPLQKVYEELEKTLIIKPLETISDLMVVYIQWENREQGKDLINAVMRVYNDYSRAVKTQEAEINADFVREKLNGISTELTILEEQIEQYKKVNEIPDLAIYGEAIMMGYEEVDKSLLETQTNLRMMDYVLEYVKHPDNQYSAVPLIEGTGEKAIEIYNTLVLERMRLLQTAEPSNPAVLLVNEQLAEQRKMLTEAITTARQGVVIALSELNKKNTQYNNIIYKLPTQEREYIELKRQQKLKETMFMYLLQKLQEKELANAPDELAARIIDPAYSSAKHEFPKGLFVLIIAFVIACAISLSIIAVKMAGTVTKCE
ncbi:hypothetical protein D0T50_07830 [Bacteroides sp. 214]|uniref:GumC family protein n=1 Tax=Bacteroides sp. 214 TaxID=2302935 RepID=UPI0013D79FEC|nr:GNVR domain-containing protein [Bacteroides sp. 214]NDW12798.1 hypothetical protein [Bacteroides sp. 214]